MLSKDDLKIRVYKYI